MSNPISLIVHQGESKASKSANEYLKSLDKNIVTERRDFKGASPVFSAKSGDTSNVPSLVLDTNLTENEINSWDLAHDVNKNLANDWSFVEVDAESDIFVQEKSFSTGGNVSGSFDKDWPPFTKNNFEWHLGDDFSQLRSARLAVEGLPHTIRIAHFDTGYIANHPILPSTPFQHQFSFLQGENPLQAIDPLNSQFGSQPGHGTATMGLLAGKKSKITENGSIVFDDVLGGAPFAEIIPCRISNSVILLKVSRFAEALNKIVELHRSGNAVHVLSMSMGGVASQAWADAVNQAYMAGITMVTAAGNNFNGVPTKRLIYPARFNRVIGACGVTNGMTPYFNKKFRFRLPPEMEGNFGPDRVMDAAMAAFTPNTPWAKRTNFTANAFDFDGAGTSSATPQIAAAAAIYYRKYFNQLNALQGWQRVEAIRNALFSSAKKTANVSNDDFKRFFGKGILQANKALEFAPIAATLAISPIDDIPFFPTLAVLFKTNTNENQEQMLNIEMMQLVQKQPNLQKLLNDEQKTFLELNKRQRKNFIDAVIANQQASLTLRKYLKDNNKILASYE